MTLAIEIEKPTQDLPMRDVKFLPDCPPWCIGEPDWHDPDYAVVHASDHHSEQVSMSGHGWDALGDVDNDFATHARAHLMVDREQGAMVQIGLGGAPLSARPGANSDAVATLDEAERFALHLLAIVALGREGGEVR